MEKEFLEVIEKYQGIILKVCRMYCRDRNDSEDLFQEIILQLWKSYPGFKNHSKLSTWMYRIALNTAISGLRKEKKRVDNQQLNFDYEDIAEEGKRIDIEYKEDLQKAIDSLNRFDKALVMLYLDEKSYREMAEIMDLSESNIGVKINRIKKKLKEKFNS